MEEIAVSRFKATYFRVLERVRKTGKPVLVTRFGKPVAEVVPPHPPKPPANWLGDMVGTGRIEGDIVAPAADEADWEVLVRGATDSAARQPVTAGRVTTKTRRHKEDIIT